MTVLDHLVWAVPDLAAGVDAFTVRTGVEPAPGGRHVGLGTANYLVGLTGRPAPAYLEIIGPTDDAPTQAPTRPFGIDALTAPRLVTWAVRADPDAGEDIEQLVTAAAVAGTDLGDVRPMSRATATGELLSWRLTTPSAPVEDGLVPFVIDWGTTPHPTTRGLPEVALRTWRATHPDPQRLARALEAMGTALDVGPGNSALVAELSGPAGSVLLTG